MKIIPAISKEFIDVVIPEKGPDTFTIFDLINYCRAIIQLYSQRDVAVRLREWKLVEMYDIHLNKTMQHMFDFMKYRGNIE